MSSHDSDGRSAVASSRVGGKITFSYAPRDARNSIGGAHTLTPTTTTMNSLYTLGVRQSSSIQADLERLRGGETSASLLGLSQA